MKTIDQNELYQNLCHFLTSKGITLDDGPYTHPIRQGCNLLTEAINATQKTVSRAKVEVDRKLDQLRQSIHEATAPTPPASPAQEPSTSGEPARSKRRPKHSAKRPARSARPRRSK